MHLVSSLKFCLHLFHRCQFHRGDTIPPVNSLGTILRDCSKNIPYLVADSGAATGLKYAAGVSLAINAQTAAYTLVATDAFKLVTVSDTVSRTITVPPSIFSVGQVINVQRIGTGAVPFAAGSGVTITSTGASSAAPTLRAQFSAASIVCTASDVFTILGDIA